MNTGLYFSCKIGGLADTTFDVVKFTLDEALSSLFTLTLTLVSKEADISLNNQLLQKASLTVLVDGEPKRTINGIVAGAERGDTGFKRTYYTITIRPELWLLTLTQNSRIFHFKSVPDILSELLAEHQVTASNQLSDPHATREFTTQKRESDYDFFCRLAAEEGIMFWFEEEGMFYSDSHLGMTAGINLIYNAHPQAGHLEYVVHRLKLGVFLRPTEAVIKDYRYSHPAVQLRFNSKGGQGNFRYFDSYGRFNDDKMGKQFSRYRLEALQADSEVGTATSNCGELMPGKLFEITEHPSASVNTRWQVVSIYHEGRQTQVLEEESSDDGSSLINECRFIPGDIDWRPPFQHKPTSDGDEIATVVGPAGEEIYVNEDGCVRIHFHWNRYDAADENASCWVRVVQGWNGDGFGFLATPRIGQEVIVSYLNGDIDRPIITGTTYNGSNRPPLNLPAEKTKTSIKTKTHKGTGFNELRFEDEAGQEEVFIHAQKDMNTKVLDNRSTDVGTDHTETIGHDQSITVGNDRTKTIGHDETMSVGNDQTMDVGNDQTETVGNNRTTTVVSNDTLTVQANQTETVYIAKAETIGAAKALTIGAAYQISVGAAMNTTVALAQAEEIGLSKSVLVGKSYSETVGKDQITTVGKSKNVSVKEHIKLVAGQSFEIVCGKSVLKMDKSGKITIKGDKYSLGTTGEQSFKASGNIKLKGKKILEN